jgi:hypothetical protein
LLRVIAAGDEDAQEAYFEEIGQEADSQEEDGEEEEEVAGPVVAFIREADNPYIWVATADHDAVMDADPEGLAPTGPTIEDGRLVFEQRYPAPHPDLTRCIRIPGTQRLYNSSNKLRDGDKFEIYPVPVYDGNDEDTLAELAQQFGEVETTIPNTRRGYGYHRGRYGYHGNEINREELKELDCVCSQGKYGILITYKPRHSVAALRAAKTRSKTAAVDVCYMEAFFNAMYNHAEKVVGGVYFRHIDWFRTRADATHCVEKMLALFIRLFGRTAHRRLIPFQQLKAKWKERHPCSIRAYANADPRYWRHTHPEAFVNWMNYECTRRRPAKELMGVIAVKAVDDPFKTPEGFNGKEYEEEVFRKEAERRKARNRQLRKALRLRRRQKKRARKRKPVRAIPMDVQGDVRPHAG